MSQIDVVIVNWNAGQQLRDCLESIEAAAATGLLGQVVVVDNASTDGSVDHLESIKLSLKVIRNDGNRGFAAACNQGAAACGSKFVLFLNPDTVVTSESLATPLHFMETDENSDVGACGIQLVDDSGDVARSCSRVPSARLLIQAALGLSTIAPRWFRGMPMIEWSHDQTRAVDQVIGAFFFVRRDWFSRLQGFDQRFFVYFEEVDFCKRLTDCGQRIMYVASAKAFHRGGGTSDQVKSHRLFYSRRSRIQYSYKHFGRFQALIVTLATLFIEPVLMASRGLLRGSPREVSEALFGFKMLWSDLPNWSRWCRRQPGIPTERPDETIRAKAA